MQNRKYFPFERNSYFHGKLLTAKDFEAEQRYLNDKRRFLNRLTGANGIVAGLGVVMADDTSVILQAGCAFDASGREIVVPETTVVKLATIEGYDSLSTDSAYLGIRYREEPADEVYAAMSDTGDRRFNKVRESYALTLLDESLAPKIPAPLEEFVAEQAIYADSEVTVTQFVPRLAVRDSDLVIRVRIEKTGRGQGEYSFAYTLEAAGFTVRDGGATVQVAMNGVRLSYGESAETCYALTPGAHIWGAGNLTVRAGGFVIRKDEESLSLNETLENQIRPVPHDLTRCYLDACYQKAMDKTLLDSYDDSLWLGKISLFRQKSAVLIDRVYPAPLGQYVYNAQQLMRLRELEAFYPGAGGRAKSTGGDSPDQVPAAGHTPALADPGRQTACGVFDLGLGLGYKPREPVFSEEIMHGLGKGPIYVEAGVEYLSADSGQGADRSEILLGDVALFAKDGSPREEERIYNVSTAVKVLPERGTFVVGVSPGEASGLISLRIRWFAMRMTEMGKQIHPARDGEPYILINPDTVVVPPKGTAHLSPVFINMASEACSFRLVDAEGGAIDNNGVYTAPAKEGVYEIRVESISDPSIYTYAFAIVTQKKKGGAGDTE